MEQCVKSIRRILNKKGWDICKYRQFYEVIENLNFDLVIDVGANRGQFVQELRASGYAGDVVSYEPCSEAFKELQEMARHDEKHVAYQSALGDSVCEKEINIHDTSEFNSFCDLNNEERLVYDVITGYSHGGEEISKNEIVNVSTLSEEFDKDRAYFDRFNKRLLKIDTQGYEKQVMGGAEDCIDKIHGVQLECSLTNLYQNQWLIEEAIAYMRERGFIPWVLKRGAIYDSREYEYDVLFIRV